jgi:hypothetical protein
MTKRSLTQISVPFNGSTFLLDVAEGKMMSLNAIYAAAGSPLNRDPRRWMETEVAKQFIENACVFLNVVQSDILKTKRGRHGGGTWAHWKIATKYAAYLDTSIEHAILDVFQERVQEEANPELGIERTRQRAATSWRRQGKSEEWIEARCKQIGNWHGFTNTLKEHEVEGIGYSKCADALNVPILKGTSKQIKALRSVPKNGSLRDALDEEEIAAISLAQVKARKQIKLNDLRGNEPCANACLDAAKKVASIL